MRMKHSPKQQKPASRAFLKAGFSLLELMLGMALVGLLLSAAWLAWQAVLEQRSRLAAQAQLASTGETVWPNLDDLIASADNARLVSAAACRSPRMTASAMSSISLQNTSTSDDRSMVGISCNQMRHV